MLVSVLCLNPYESLAPTLDPVGQVDRRKYGARELLLNAAQQQLQETQQELMQIQDERARALKHPGPSASGDKRLISKLIVSPGLYSAYLDGGSAVEAEFKVAKYCWWELDKTLGGVRNMPAAHTQQLLWQQQLGAGLSSVADLPMSCSRTLTMNCDRYACRTFSHKLGPCTAYRLIFGALSAAARGLPCAAPGLSRGCTQHAQDGKLAMFVKLGLTHLERPPDYSN